MDYKHGHVTQHNTTQHNSNLPIKAKIALIILMMLFFHSQIFYAQIKIKERVEIKDLEINKITNLLNSSNLPCFGKIIDSKYLSILRDCNVTCTGTLTYSEVSFEPRRTVCIVFDVNKVVTNGSATKMFPACTYTGLSIINTLPMSCSPVVWYNYSVSENTAKCTGSGVLYACCFNWCAEPFTFSVEFSAVPINEPTTVKISSRDTRIVSSGQTDIGAWLADQNGNGFGYCGDNKRITFAIRNPFAGVCLKEGYWDAHNNSITQITYEDRLDGRVFFSYNGSSLPNYEDSAKVTVQAEALGLSNTTDIMLISVYPHSFKVTPEKDKIKTNEATKIFVTAQYNSKDAEWSDTKNVTIQSDGFFIVNNDTIPNEVIVPYGTAKSGGVQFFQKCVRYANQYFQIDVKRTDNEKIKGSGYVVVSPIPDHYRIYPDKDEIEFYDDVKLTLIAEDETNAEVTLNVNPEVTLYADGSFIYKNDTIPNTVTVPYDDARAGAVHYYSNLNLEDYTQCDFDNNMLNILIDVDVTNKECPYPMTSYGYIKVYVPCVNMDVEKNSIATSDTTKIFLTAKFSDGREEPFPAHYQFKLKMNADKKYGRIRCVSNGAEGTEIIGYQPFEFISADSIDMDEVKIHLTASYAMDDCYGSGYWAYMLLQSALNVNMINPTVQQNVQASVGATCKDGEDVTIGGMDHFDISIIPDTASVADTVAYTEGAKLIITAKDKEEKEFDLDKNSLISIEVTSGTDYGTLININNDTLWVTPVKLTNVKYGDALAGKIKFAAVKKNPIALQNINCNINVKLESKPDKKGDKEAIVVEQTLKIVMAAPYEVRPSIPTEDSDKDKVEKRKKKFEVKMTRGGVPVKQHPFKLKTDYINTSGGHKHSLNPTLKRAKNDDGYGFFTLEGNSKRSQPFDTLTNAEGKFVATYNASIFGDTMKIYVNSNKKPLLLKDSIIVTEKVDSLINFRNVDANSQWTFAQSSDGEKRHPDNNWCSPEMRDSLKKAIGAFYKWSKEEFGVAVVLSLNDMSLLLGGRFDMNATWDGRTSQSHLFHRVGTSVDINEQAIDSCKIKKGLPNGKWEWGKVGDWLKKIFKDSGLYPAEERTIHFELKKQKQ